MFRPSDLGVWWIGNRYGCSTIDPGGHERSVALRLSLVSHHFNCLHVNMPSCIDGIRHSTAAVERSALEMPLRRPHSLQLTIPGSSSLQFGQFCTPAT